jgi:beta-lactam-binding protein with PASTA domain
VLGDSLKRRRQGPSRKDPSPRRTKRSKPGAVISWLASGFSWLRWLVLALAVLAVSYGTGYLLSMFVLFPRPETAGAGIAVPDLAGRSIADAESVIQDAGLVVGEIRELKSMTADSGRVLAQDPVPGQQLLPGATVSLGVSTGPPELQVPPVVGLRQDAARDLLEAVGFDVEVQQTRSTTSPAGVVTRAEPAAGTPLELPATITLVVSTGAPGDSNASSGGQETGAAP